MPEWKQFDAISSKKLLLEPKLALFSLSDSAFRNNKNSHVSVRSGYKVFDKLVEKMLQKAKII